MKKKFIILAICLSACNSKPNTKTEDYMVGNDTLRLHINTFTLAIDSVTLDSAKIQPWIQK